MTDPASLLPPSGWYPDPGGERQWREWDGQQWANVTQPFGDPVSPSARQIEVLRSHDSLLRYGVAVYYAGIALVINAYHLRPSTLSSMTPAIYNNLVISGVILFFLGHLSYARATASLATGGSWLQGVPLLNTATWVRRAFRAAPSRLALGPWGIAESWAQSRVADVAAGLQIAWFIILAGFATWSTTSIAINVICTMVVVTLPVVVNVQWALSIRDEWAS